ncbi:hypothetical protein CPter291_1846 [Collimonas pratensis]|uniref:Uncharacterized protein n=1 Tax=Collimonas pratensis TaxID=279113 RepID=A0ABN4M780_9BURK|nr:hypothetical protein CPter291_1846 [Collimonas pratensis]
MTITLTPGWNVELKVVLCIAYPFTQVAMLYTKNILMLI